MIAERPRTSAAQRILLAYLFVLPLIPASFNVLAGLPWTHDRVLAALLFAAYLIAAAKKGFEVSLRLPLLLSTLVLLAVQAWSLRWSIEPLPKNLFPLFSLGIQVLLLWACVNEGWGPKGREFREKAERTLVLSGTVVALLGVFETVRGSPLLPTDLIHLRGGFLRAQSTLLNPIRFGAFLGMLLPVAIGCALRYRTRWAWVQAGAVLLGALSSFSRSAYLALAFVCIAGPFWWGFPGLQKWRSRARWLALPVVLATGIGLLVLPGFVGTQSLVNVTNRIYMARIALDMWRQHPVLGIGFQNFPRYAPAYHIWGLQAPVQVVLDDVKMDPNPLFSDSLRLFSDEPPILGHPWAENTCLALAAETGSLGLLAYLWWAVLSLAMLWRCRGAPPRDGYFLGLVVFHGVSLFFDVHLSFILVYEASVFLGLGLASGCAAGEGPRKEP